MYGYFECSKCKGRWESAKVYPKRTGSTEYWQQECKKCRIYCSPYRVDETICSMCGEVASECDCDKTHHTDPNKPHRSDLCEKCKAGHPCQ